MKASAPANANVQASARGERPGASTSAPRAACELPLRTDRRSIRLVVLGSTGSIGRSTLEVIRAFQASGEREVRVAGLAAGRNATELIEQARAFDVQHVSIADPGLRPMVSRALPRAVVHAGDDAALQLVESVEATDVISAVVGSAGLPATFAAIRKGCRIGLANKETLVAAGGIVSSMLQRHGAELLPVDSEHSAIFQCLVGQPASRIERVVLTASGGPFRSVELDVMRRATVDQALNHPTWRMGPKITIDSATMMNKSLEVIEAHWLFGLPRQRIEVILHPQSVVHSFVEFNDHSVLAQLGPPDMKTPIQYALTYPDRSPGCSRAMDWSTLSQLTFEPPDHEKFPSLGLAYDVIDAGGTAGAIFNAANEVAVDAFLERRIAFGRIVELAAETLSAIAPEPAEELDAVLEADRRARAWARRRLKETDAA